MIGSIILYFVYRSNQAAFIEDCLQKGIAEADCSLVQKIMADFSTVKISWIVIVIIAFMVSNLSRARRWNLMLHPLGYYPRLINSFMSVMVAYFANLGIPRSGEFIRAGTLSKYEDIPFEKLMGTIVLDRIIDVVCLLGAIVITLFFEFDVFYNYLSEKNVIGSKTSFLNFTTLGVGVLILLIGVIGIWYSRKKLTNSNIYQKISLIVRGFIEGLMSIRTIKRPFEFLFHSVFIWFLYFMMIYLCFFSYGPTENLTVGAGLVTFVFGAIGIIFPSPGGMGSYHYMVTEGLNLYGVNPSDGFTFAMIAFVAIQIFCNIFFGIIALVSLPIINKSAKQ